MNKLRVAKKNEYVIEVNDNGDTISLNIEDPTLYLRFEKAYEDVQKIWDKTKGKLLVLEKKEDVKDKGKLLSRNNREMLKLYDEMYREMRLKIDGILGENACQKIFGDTNYLTMFDELFEQLAPHFEKMGMNAQNLVKSIETKYGDNDEEDVLMA